MEFADSFRKLNVYQRARSLAREIFELSQDFPDDEQYSLTDQVRRSSRSVGAQIAESWGHRRYVKSFRSKLIDGYGEINETIHWLETAGDCEYLGENTVENYVSECLEIQKMINSMIEKAEEFCDSHGDYED
jgi:four helix bundle protein